MSKNRYNSHEMKEKKSGPKAVHETITHTTVSKRRIVLRVVAVVVVCLSILSLAGFLLFQKVTDGKGISLLNSFLTLPDYGIAQKDGRTAILLLGRGGILNDTPNLTDTMIVAVLDRNTNKISLISLPRDIWSVTLKAKINHAYLVGREKGRIEAFSLAKQESSVVVGIPIQYAAVIDYSGFIGIIDALGGVEVHVSKTFTDTKYPIFGKEKDLCNGDKTYSCRYETITFNQGSTHMDGLTALKYVRSRHSSDPLEGNDLARAARQQEVIAAIQSKAMSVETLTSISKIIAVRDAVFSSIETDIVPEEAAVLARFLLNNRSTQETYVVDSKFLYSPPEKISPQKQFIFLPKGGNWNEVHQWVNSILASPSAQPVQASALP
jgi:anionic cell wall polymer biosynthesis LytR-Cps2A-Psr (LCP) family protein